MLDFPKRLKPHFKPFIWGIGTTVALFATFRISKNTGSLRKGSKGYQFDNLQKSKTRKEKLSDATSIPTDILLSMIVGVSSALFLTDEEKIKDDLSQMPLVQGRSLVSEELCTDFIKEYRKISPQMWTSKEANGSSSMQAIKSFVNNCQKRETLVDYRNKELKLLNREDAEIIPSPGVLEHLSRIEVASKE